MRPAADLDPAAVAAVAARGWALVPGYLSAGDTAALIEAVQRLVAPGGAAPGCMVFLDRFPGGETRLARLERVADALPPLQGPLGTRLAADAALCLGGPVVPFKDKLNLRYPGSPGYAPHQDGARWDRFARRFLSFGLFLAPSDAARGGFEMTLPDAPVGRLPDRGGDLPAALYDPLPVEAVRARAGDALVIDGDVPHRTTANRSSDTIPHLLVTYALSGDAGLRAAHYAGLCASFSAQRIGPQRYAFRRPGPPPGLSGGT